MKASIDIGTNTALLLVADRQDGKLRILEEQQRVPRLGEGVDESKNISASAVQRVSKAIEEYQAVIKDEYPAVKELRVVATSAVRDANNREEVLQQIKKRTGIHIKVLSGFEEAQYTFSGAQSVLNDFSTNQKVVIDIGGGSTEVASGQNNVRDRYSYNMGCVRFTERFLKDDPPTGQQISECRKAIRDMLETYEFNFADESVLIGVAGTVTSLAYIDQGLKIFNSEKLNGYEISLKKLQRYISEFKEWPVDKLVDTYPVVMKGRGDIFLAGLLILESFMQHYSFDRLITSTGGIRHGILLDS